MTETDIRTRMESHRPRPSHICVDCGALVSSEHDWPAVHAGWHASLEQEDAGGE